MSKRRLYEVRTKISKVDGSWCGQALADVDANVIDIAEVWGEEFAEVLEYLADEVRDWVEGAEVST